MSTLLLAALQDALTLQTGWVVYPRALVVGGLSIELVRWYILPFRRVVDELALLMPTGIIEVLRRWLLALGRPIGRAQIAVIHV